MNLVFYCIYVVFPCLSLARSPSLGGVHFHSSCQKDAQNLTLALRATEEIIQRGILEATGRKSYTFNTLFREEDRPLVARVYATISAAIRGHGPLVNLTCFDTSPCDTIPKLLGYTTLGQYMGETPRIHLCPRVWEPEFYRLKPDYCIDEQAGGGPERTNTRTANDGWSISLTLLHELVHIRALTGVAVADYAYSYDECKQLAEGSLLKGRKYESDGYAGPTENAESYTFMPMGSMRAELVAIGGCRDWKYKGTDMATGGRPAEDRTELRRRLQSVLEGNLNRLRSP